MNCLETPSQERPRPPQLQWFKAPAMKKKQDVTASLFFVCCFFDPRDLSKAAAS